MIYLLYGGYGIKENELEQEPTSVSCTLAHTQRQTIISYSHECFLFWAFAPKEIYSFNKHLRINLATLFRVHEVPSWEEDLY